MATDFNSENNYSNPFQSFLQAAATITPIGAGAYLGYQNLKSNSAISPSNFGSSNTLGRLGKDVGKILDNVSTTNKQQRMEAAESFAKKLLESDGVDKLLRTVQDRNAVIQSILTTVDDPMSGLDTATAQGFRNDLLNAMENFNEEDLKKAIAATFNDIFDNNKPALRVFEGQLREFKKVSSQLVLPTFKTKASQPFIKLNNLTDKAQGRLATLNKHLGGSGYHVDLSQVIEHTGAIGQYAQVYRRGPDGRKNFITNVPLDLNSNNVRTPYGLIRMGEAATAYRADRMLLNAAGLYQDFSTSGSLTDALIQKHTTHLEDYFIHNFGLQIGTDQFDKNNFNESIRSILTNENRGARRTDELGHHLRMQGRLQSNVARLYGLENMSKRAKGNLLEAMAGYSYFDLGVGADRLAEQRFDNGTFSAVGIREGSAYSMMRTGYENIPGMAKNRILEPITARLEQVANRISQGSMFGKRQSSTGPGLRGQLGTGNSPILWSEGLTGGINKAVLMDVNSSGEIYNQLNGSGQAYHFAQDLTYKTNSIPVLDPSAHVLLSSKVLNDVIAAGDQGVTLTKQQVKEAGAYLGVGSGGVKGLPYDPRMVDITLTHSSTSSNAGKQTLHIDYVMRRKQETLKLFSRLFKGNAVEGNYAHIANKLASGYDFELRTLHNMGIAKEDLLITSGEMLKKSPLTFMRQMSTGYGLVSGDADWESTLGSLAQQIQRGQISDFGLGNEGKNPLGIATASVIHALGKAGVSEDMAGRVLAAVYNRGVAGDKSWLKGQNSNLALQQEAIDLAVQQTFKNSAGVLASARKGLAIGADTALQGEGVGDWTTARGSVEPRFVQNLHARLRDTKLSNKDISNIVASIYKRKIGFEKGLDSAGFMLDMLQNVKGGTTLAREMFSSSKGQSITVEALVQGIQDHGSLSAFARKSAGGLSINLGTHSNLHTEDALKSAVRSVMGGADSLFIPGTEAFEAFAETSIKTVGGEKNIDLGSDYSRMLDRFGRDLINALGAANKTSESLAAPFKNFQNDVVELATHTFHNLGSGKIKGASYAVATQYDTLGLLPEQHSRVEQILSKSKGTAVFMDDYGFLSMVKDYSKAGNEYDKNGRVKLNRAKETAKMLETFYLGGELPGKQIRGLGTISARHPMLSRGNVAITELFRDVRATGQFGREDEVFNAIQESEWGRKALRKLGNSRKSKSKNKAKSKKKINFNNTKLNTVRNRRDNRIRSFRDLARLPKGSQEVKDFFKAFARNIDSMSAEGGGRLFMPRASFDVHYGMDKKVTVDFGLASQAFGDFDGDSWSVFLLDKRASQKIMSTITDPTKEYMRAETIYRIKKEVYAEEAKNALDRLATKAGAMTEQAVHYQDALKEKASKEATGMVDIELANIKRSVINLPGLSGEEASGPLGLLGVLEEHTTIKGKKLPTYHPYAEKLTEGVRQLVKTGDDVAFRMVMKQLFDGSSLNTESATVTDIKSPDLTYVDKGVIGYNINLEEDIEIIIEAARAHRTKYSSGGIGGSAREMANALKIGGHRTMDVMRDLFQVESSFQAGFMSGRQTQGEAAAAGAGVVSDQIMNILNQANRKAVGYTITGIALAGITTATMGRPAYAPSTLDAEGVLVPNNISNAVANGEVLQTQDPNISTDQLAHPADSYGMMNRNLNPGTTYLNKSNSFQIEGETGSNVDFPSIAGYISGINGGSGRVSVNMVDNRQPITSNYLDRLTGEY